MKIFACLRYSFARASLSDARSKLSHSIESEKPSVVIVEPKKRSELAAAAVDAEKCEMPGQQRRQSQPEKRREPNEYVRRIEVFRLVRRNIVQARGRERRSKAAKLCNRNGKEKEMKSYQFRPSNEQILHSLRKTLNSEESSC